jgi:cell division septal protein FtsQ
LLKLDPDCNILLLDLSALSARVRSDPWIEEAAICRRLPHTLMVKIMERRPAGILVVKDRYLISEDGVILPRLPKNEAADLPFIHLATAEGRYQTGDAVQTGPFQRGSTVWRDLSQTLRGLGAQIREVYQTKDGSLSFHLGGGMPSLRLRAESFEEQCTRLKEALASYGSDWRSLEYIDLRFSGKVILKPLGK